jgi:ubiquinone/menaquinone biosynthesis C-methylase UbiE
MTTGMNERKTHWENVYRNKTADEVSWYQARPEISLELIQKTGIRKSAPIVDIGGGASRLVDHLLEMGYSDISVLDISWNALDQTRSRLGKAAAGVNWLEGDITNFRFQGPVELWHDRAVFHFLTAEEDRSAYLDNLHRTLQNDGHLILAAFSPDGPTRCSGLEIVQYDQAKIERTLGNGFTLMESASEAHVTPGGATQHFNYFMFRKN